MEFTLELNLSSVNFNFTPQLVLDTDAANFLAVLNIDNPVIITAVNNLFLRLKVGPINSSDIFARTKAYKPTVGGTAVAHAIDALTPSSRAATYFGSPTHGSVGITLNGLSQYILNGYNNADCDTVNFSKFTFVKADTGTTGTSSLFGLMHTSSFASIVGIERNNGNNNRFVQGFNNANTLVNVPSPYSGLVGGGRRSTTHLTRYFSGVATEYVEARQTNTVRSTQTAFGAIALFNGSVTQFFKGTLRGTWEGLYLNAAQYEDLKQTLILFDTELAA